MRSAELRQKPVFRVLLRHASDGFRGGSVGLKGVEAIHSMLSFSQ